MTPLLIAILVFLIFIFWGWPYLRGKIPALQVKSLNTARKVWEPIRKAYIKQTKEMIEKYNIKKEELFDE